MSIKPLFIAFACEPEKGSESGIGWNSVFHASRTRPVWVITHALHRKRIEACLGNKDERNINITYHELLGVGEWLWKYPSLLNLYYYLWQFSAARVARRLHEEHQFDVVHHVSYVRYWMPSAAGFLGIPFVWGPVGGGESAPSEVIRSLGFKAQAIEFVRTAARWIFERLPGASSCAKAADVSIACSSESAERMKRLGVKNLITLSCIGTNLSQRAPESAEVTAKIRFISVGRLLYWKGFEFGLRAFAMANIPDAEYVVVGDGPELTKLKSVAEDLGISDRTKFTGALPWRKGLVQFMQADVLVHPSLHDSGGFVLLEAMELAKPVICLKLGGPAMHVDSRNGFAIPAVSAPQIIEDIANAMTQLASDPDLRKRLGEAGRNRAVDEFTWESKAGKFEIIYQQIIRSKAMESLLEANAAIDSGRGSK